MRVVMPYTEINSEVIDALNATEYPYDRIDVSAKDDSYFDLINGLWNDRKTFATVEHDIVIDSDTLSRYEECSSDWCVTPYPYFVSGGYYVGLGCCKISKNMIGRHPLIMQKVYETTDATHPVKGHWCRLDGWLRHFLEESGEKMCIHEPPIRHLGSNWPSHGCVKPPETT